jgi:serine/threonine-protein kinase RsbW
MRADAPVSIRMRLPRDVTSLRLARAVTDEALAACGAGADSRQDVAIALTEACTNAVRHATAAKGFEVNLHVEDGVCTVEVVDQGNGFVLDDQPVLPPANTIRGRGLYLIAQLADHVEVDTQPGGGTKVRFVKQLQPATDDVAGAGQ